MMTTLAEAISCCGAQPFNVESVSLLLRLSQKMGIQFRDMLHLKLCINCDFFYLKGSSCPKCMSEHFAYIVYWERDAWWPVIFNNAFDFVSIL